MPRISLATYTIRLHQKWRPQDLEVLRAFGPGRDDLLDVIENFVTRLATDRVRDEGSQSILTLENVTRRGNTISGRLLAGDYGYTAQLVDVQSARSRYGRRVRDAELVPLFFSITIPNGRKTGIAVFQRFGTTGIRSMFAKGLNNHVGAQFQEHLVVMNPLLPKEVLESLLQGELKAIEMVTFKVPKDLTDAVRAEEYEKDEAYLVREIKARRGISLRKPQWLRDLAAGRITAAEVIHELDEDINVLKVNVDYNGSTRTVDFSRMERLSPYVDVSQEVELLEGHPTFDSIERLARDMTSEMLTRLGQEEEEEED